MKAKVIKLDGEVGLFLPNEIVSMLHLKEGQELHISQLADGGFRIGTKGPAYDKGMQIARKAMVKYAETFKALAKS